MQKTPPNCKVGLGEMFLVVCNLQHTQMPINGVKCQGTTKVTLIYNTTNISYAFTTPVLDNLPILYINT